ncbi:MAG: hypothetical protein R3F19_16540 [Verrucomicrobiales bacterium]
MALPKSPVLRISLGAALVIGGVFGFLPVVGYWMIPLGLIVLSVDIPSVRRWRRKLEVRWGRWRQRRREAKSSSAAAFNRVSA